MAAAAWRKYRQRISINIESGIEMAAANNRVALIWRRNENNKHVKKPIAKNSISIIAHQC
jgi:hypothetical protein